MMEYPKERVYMMRKEVEFEKQKRADADLWCKKRLQRIFALEQEIRKLSQMNSNVEQLRQKVYGELAPAKQAIIEMQKLIIALYKELGQSDYSAWFFTYCET